MEVVKITTNALDSTTYAVEIEGEIDVSTSPRIKETLNRLIDEGHVHLVVNLEQVRYIDSTGLVAFISALKRVRENHGKIVLICTNPHLLKILDITGLINVFEVYQTLEEAMRILQGAT